MWNRWNTESVPVPWKITRSCNWQAVYHRNFGGDRSRLTAVCKWVVSILRSAARIDRVDQLLAVFPCLGTSCKRSLAVIEN